MKFIVAIVLGVILAFGTFCFVLVAHRVVWLTLDAWLRWCDWHPDRHAIDALSVMATFVILALGAGLAGAIASDPK